MFKLEPRPAPSKVLSLASPLIALLITIVVGIGLFMALGKDPLAGLQMFLVEPLKSPYALSELSVKAVPLILIALGLAVCFKANIWNIGAEGQFILGAVFAGGVAMRATPETGSWIVVAVLLAGVLGGMVWAGIVALLRDRFNASEILVSLMLVYVAEMVLSYLVYGPWKDPAGYNFPQTITFPDVTRLPKLIQGLRLNVGVFVALAAVVAFTVFLYRTFTGFQLQVGGLAPMAARYAGFSSRKALWTGLLRCAGCGRTSRTAHTVCAHGLWLCGHHRGLCGAPQSRGHRVLRRAHEHVLHRGRAGAISPGVAQGAHGRLPGPVAVCLAGL